MQGRLRATEHSPGESLNRQILRDTWLLTRLHEHARADTFVLTHLSVCQSVNLYICLYSTHVCVPVFQSDQL